MFTRSQRFAALTALLAGGLAACSSDAPTAPSAAPTAGTASVAPTALLVTGCPFTVNALDALMIAALPQGLENAATSRFDNVERQYDNFKETLAQDKARELVAWLEKKYDEGQFSQGKTEAAQLQLLQMKTAIFCLVGLPFPTSIDIGTKTIGFVYPGTPVTIARGDETAGASFPANAVSVPTQITIEPRSEPLPTDLTQYPSFFQFTANPAVPFNAPVTVGVCLDGKPPAGTDIRLARGIGTNVGDIEILTPASFGALSFLDCGDDALLPDAIPAAPFPHPGLSAMGSATLMFERVTPRVMHALGTMLLPAPAHASALLACCRLGGQVGSFSPFGGVDVNSAQVVSSRPTTVTLGAGSSTPVTVKLTNKDNGLALRGEDVNFVVTLGNGSVAPVNVRTTSSPATGLASATWTLGAGANTLEARAVVGRARATAPVIVPVAIPGSPIIYSGTGTTATTFGFGAADWTVNTYATQTALDAELSGLAAGTKAGTLAQAGFSNALTSSTCSIYNAGSLKSSSFPLGGYVAIRRDFVAPAGAATAQLSVSIDNDFRVFLNGTEITSGVTGRRNGGSDPFVTQTAFEGWFKHDGCPGGTTTPSGDFLVPLTGLNAVSNQLLILGRDRGERSFLDAAIVP